MPEPTGPGRPEVPPAARPQKTIAVPWSEAKPAIQRRRGAMSLRVSGSRILMAGGVDARSGATLDGVELWNPNDGSWSSAGRLTRPRVGGLLTDIGEGRALVTGGCGEDGALLAGTESWDMNRGCEDAGAMTVPRVGHAASFCAQNRRVLVCGGAVDSAGTLTATAEIWNTSHREWTPTYTMRTPRRDHTVTFLWNRTALAVGGRVEGGATTANCELWDAAPQAWIATPSMSRPRANHAAIELAGRNEALVWSERSAEIVHARGTTALAPELRHSTWVSFLLEDGRVLCVVKNDAALRPFLFDPRRNEREWLPSWPGDSSVTPVGAWLLGDGRIAVLCDTIDERPQMFVTLDAITLGALPGHLTAIAFRRSEHPEGLAAELASAIAEVLRSGSATQVIDELRELGHPMREFEEGTYCYDWSDAHLNDGSDLVVTLSDPSRPGKVGSDHWWTETPGGSVLHELEYCRRR